MILDATEILKEIAKRIKEFSTNGPNTPDLFAIMALDDLRIWINQREDEEIRKMYAAMVDQNTKKP